MGIENYNLIYWIQFKHDAIRLLFTKSTSQATWDYKPAFDIKNRRVYLLSSWVNN